MIHGETSMIARRRWLTPLLLIVTATPPPPLLFNATLQRANMFGNKIFSVKCALMAAVLALSFSLPAVAQGLGGCCLIAGSW